MTPADPLPIRRDGVLLRRLAVADLADFQAYRQDAELGRFQGWEPVSDAEATSFLAEMGHAPLFRPGQWNQLGIADPASGRLLGDIGLLLRSDGDGDTDAPQAEIGYTLSRAAQGRGLATAAVAAALELVFTHSPAQQVQAVTDVRNTASVRLLERLGLQLQDTRHALYKGELCQEHVYVARSGDAARRRPTATGSAMEQTT